MVGMRWIVANHIWNTQSHLEDNDEDGDLETSFDGVCVCEGGVEVDGCG